MRLPPARLGATLAKPLSSTETVANSLATVAAYSAAIAAG